MSQLVLGGIKQLDRRLRRVENATHAPIYGAYWDKDSDPTLSRTHDAIGMEANVGLDNEWAQNDFDRAEIFGEMGDVVDSYGNVFVRIPKFYIRKTDGVGYKTWQVSKARYPGFYLPWCFWDFDRGRELPYVDVGKHLASLGDGNRLESKPGVMPLASINIVNARTYARNNNVGGLTGYQQLDIHVYDVLQTLMTIEFATLDMQSVMYGFSNGVYSAYTAEIAEEQTNRVVATNARAAAFRVGQSIAIGTAYSNNNVSGGARLITAIEPYDENWTSIVFDGSPIDIELGHQFSNRSYLTGWSSRIAASSGGIVSLSDGKYPCMYRGVESPYSDMWQFVDGVNINNYQAWVARDARDYASNVFAAPYEQLSYGNRTSNEYAAEMGHDTARPYAEFPVADSTAGSASTYYCDYYYQNTGQRIARVGGRLFAGGACGPWYWTLSYPSSTSAVSLGARLLRKDS